jgi:flagellar basal body-associated protein FliL
MSFKSQPTKEAEKRIQENKSKKDKEMKNLTSKFKTQITVAVTLAVVAAFAAVFYMGTQYQQNQHDVITKARAEAVAEVASSKTNGQ